jgi:hypothetical protein
MKIKSDFITNSSSTCFFLQYNISLKEKAGKTDIKKIEENLKEIVNKYKVLDENPEVHCYSSSCYLNDFVYLKDEESGYDTDEPENLPRITIGIEQGQLYNEKLDETQDSLLMNITARTGLLNSDPKDLYINKLVEILHDCLKDVPGTVSLFFSQIPTDICGDGWNTGDPMGQYSTTYELFTKQTNIGKIIRSANSWKIHLKNKMK